MTTDELQQLRDRVDDLEQTILALREGDVDAVVGSAGDSRLYSLVSADRPYRVIVEKMGQGAATTTAGGVLLFVNDQLAALLDVRREALVGRDLADHVRAADRAALDELLAVGAGATRRGEVALATGSGAEVAVLVACTALDLDGEAVRCLVVTDLTQQKVLEQRQAEEAQREEQREERARVAREVNDTIVQGLVAAEMALDLGQVDQARAAVARTSARARDWIGELVEGDELHAGMAVRTTPSHPGGVV